MLGRMLGDVALLLLDGLFGNRLVSAITLPLLGRLLCTAALLMLGGQVGTVVLPLLGRLHYH